MIDAAWALWAVSESSQPAVCHAQASGSGGAAERRESGEEQERPRSQEVQEKRKRTGAAFIRRIKKILHVVCMNKFV